MWKYDGTYTIKVNYGTAEKSNSAKVELTGGVASETNYQSPNKQCSAKELSANGQCVPFSISGGTVTSATLNTNDNSIVIMINAEEDGTLTVSPSKTVQDGIFMVLVDGEEWDDVEIVANKVTVMFPAGAETIEIIGTFVIPEFGTIAAMILAVAIISIIAVSAKSRLSIIPRY
jgi:predicted secreted protein with PEFG-CTERM motif